MMRHLIAFAFAFTALCLPIERLLAHSDRRRRRTVIVIGNRREVV